MKYASVCSGVEAASQAWCVINGWEPVFFSEIEPFPCAVLKHHYPNVPNLGDMTKITVKDGAITNGETTINEKCDLLVGGTPCQAYSIAGLRQGLQTPVDKLHCSTLDWLMNSGFAGSSGKTYPEYCPKITEELSAPFYPQWQEMSLPPPPPTVGEQLELFETLDATVSEWHGECLTLNMCEWTVFHEQCHKDEGVSSLSDILETGDLPQRYYLSRGCCLGILRRAEQRNKTLPSLLKTALEIQCCVSEMTQQTHQSTITSAEHSQLGG